MSCACETVHAFVLQVDVTGITFAVTTGIKVKTRRVRIVGLQVAASLGYQLHAFATRTEEAPASYDLSSEVAVRLFGDGLLDLGKEGRYLYLAGRKLAVGADDVTLAVTVETPA